MFAKPILWPSYPTEWDYVKPPLTTRHNKQQGGTPRFGDHTQPQGAGEQGEGQVSLYQQGQYQQGRNEQSRGTQQQWTNPRNTRHPKI